MDSGHTKQSWDSPAPSPRGGLFLPALGTYHGQFHLGRLHTQTLCSLPASGASRQLRLLQGSSSQEQRSSRRTKGPLLFTRETETLRGRRPIRDTAVCKKQAHFSQSSTPISSSPILGWNKGSRDVASAILPVLVLLPCPKAQQHRSPGWTYAAQVSLWKSYRSHLWHGVSRVVPATFWYRQSHGRICPVGRHMGPRPTMGPGTGPSWLQM